MHRRQTAVTGLVLAAAMATIVPGAHGQLQRRSATPPQGAPPPPANAAVNRRYPYAGAWRGSRTMSDAPGGVATDAIGMTFDVADSVKGLYEGAMVLPNGARAPFRELTSTQAGLTWEQPNSGGGKWVYSDRLMTRDSIAGTLVLRGAPWKPAWDPSGTFVLTRRKEPVRP
jgi:hypothetical protein